MKHFYDVNDVSDPLSLVKKASACKEAPFADQIGARKTLGLIFFNPSLRTRLSTIRAAKNLGMEVIVMNIADDSWKLEFEDGAVMDGGKAEHIREATAVLGSYCDILGVRAFPSLTNREEDYRESVINAFIKFSGKPVINLESATLHPLQSLADLLTIEENKAVNSPKVVLTWAPHVRALPQSVANSFAQWVSRTNYDFVIAAPEGFELSPQFGQGIDILHDQEQALDGAHFVYAKNWSSYSAYGKIGEHRNWKITEDKMALTDNGRFMHCLPIRRNVVADDRVLDSESSLHIEQATNRIWATQAVLSEMLHDT